MSASKSPRLPVLVAVVLAIVGVGFIVSGVLVVLDGRDRIAGPTTTIATATPPTSAPDTTTSLSPPVAVEFVALTDATGTIAYEAPSTWIDVSTGAWTSDGVDIGPSLSAAVDLEAWISGWETPGMFVGVTDQMSATDALGDFGGACEMDRIEPVTVGGAGGTAQWWWSCGPAATSFYVAVVTLDSGSIILFQILEAPEALPAVVTHVLGTFDFTG